MHRLVIGDWCWVIGVMMPGGYSELEFRVLSVEFRVSGVKCGV